MELNQVWYYPRGERDVFIGFTLPAEVYLYWHKVIRGNQRRDFARFAFAYGLGIAYGLLAAWVIRGMR